MPLIRKLVSPVIGLGAEAIAHHKNKKKGKAGEEKDQAQEDQPQEDQPRDDRPPSYDQSAHLLEQGGSSLPDRGYPSPQSDHPVQQSTDSKERGIDSKEPGVDSEDPETFEAFDENPPPYEPAADSESDEEDWAADEAAPAPKRDGSCVPKGKAGGPATVDDIVSAFLAAYPAQPSGNFLPCPVIIPQKRPGKNTRGFVHAYSLALAAMGIEERAWMDFYQCFEESIKVHPVFDAINVAAQIVGFVPEPAAQAASIAVTFVDETARRVYQRGRYNNFLAQLNEKYFRQFGLFAMIMVYDPYSTSINKTFDLSTTIAKAEQDPDTTGVKLALKNVKGVTGRTRGKAQMPQAAELVFPAIDKPEGENWFKRSTGFVNDYIDRRAQAHYAAAHPGSSLAVAPQFESSAGGMGTSTLSKSERRDIREDAYKEGTIPNYNMLNKRERKWARKTGAMPQQMAGKGMRVRRRGGYGGPVSLLITAASGGKLKGRDANPIAIVKRTLKPNTLYLMVTQRPTEEQLAATREMLEVKKETKESTKE